MDEIGIFLASVHARDAEQDPWKYPKMPDPKKANFRDFYPHEIWPFLSVFWLNPRRWPIFIRTMDQADAADQASKIFFPTLWAAFLRIKICCLLW